MSSGLRIVRPSSSLPAKSFFIRYASTKPSNHIDHKRSHVYMAPSHFVGSWEPPKHPREAEARLALLRRDYAKQVKEVRKQYIYEVELMRQEKMRKDEARREEVTREREERNKSKAAAAEARAAERKAFEDEFRKTLLKERREKLEYWRTTEREEHVKRTEKKELLHRQSSRWIDENELYDRILEAVVDTRSL